MNRFPPLCEHNFPPEERRHERIQPEPAPRTPRILGDPFALLLLPLVLTERLAAAETTTRHGRKVHLGQPQDLQPRTLRTPAVVTFARRILVQFRDPTLVFFHRTGNIDRLGRVAEGCLSHLA